MRLIDQTYPCCTQQQQPCFVLLEGFHQHLVPRTYVEIGVSTARSLIIALQGTVRIGIDPSPRTAFPLSRQPRVFAQAGDDFFANYEPRNYSTCQMVSLSIWPSSTACTISSTPSATS